MPVITLVQVGDAGKSLQLNVTFLLAKFALPYNRGYFSMEDTVLNDCYSLGLPEGVRIFTNLYFALENTDMTSPCHTQCCSTFSQRKSMSRQIFGSTIYQLCEIPIQLLELTEEISPT